MDNKKRKMTEEEADSNKRYGKINISIIRHNLVVPIEPGLHSIPVKSIAPTVTGDTWSYLFKINQRNYNLAISSKVQFDEKTKSFIIPMFPNSFGNEIMVKVISTTEIVNLMDNVKQWCEEKVKTIVTNDEFKLILEYWDMLKRCIKETGCCWCRGPLYRKQNETNTTKWRIYTYQGEVSTDWYGMMEFFFQQLGMNFIIRTQFELFLMSSIKVLGKEKVIGAFLLADNQTWTSFKTYKSKLLTKLLCLNQLNYFKDATTQQINYAQDKQDEQWKSLKQSFDSLTPVSAKNIDESKCDKVPFEYENIFIKFTEGLKSFENVLHLPLLADLPDETAVFDIYLPV